MAEKLYGVTPGLIAGKPKAFGWSKGQLAMWSDGALMMWGILSGQWWITSLALVIFFGLGIYKVWNPMENGQDFLGMVKG